MKNDKIEIGDEKYFFIPEDKVLKINDRIKLFKKMSMKESKTWKTLHHVKRVFSDIIVVNLNIFLFFKIYFTICDPLLSYYQNIMKSFRLKGIFLSLGVFNLLFIRYSYKKLPELIYMECYHHLSDREFIQLYNYVTNPTIKYYKPV